MRSSLTIVLILLLFAVKGRAQDEFTGLTCGSDIPRALVGRHSVNGRAVTIEQRHKDIQLRALGATEIYQRLQMVSWSICGREYELLINSKSRVADVLLFPEHSKSAPEAIGGCYIHGKEIPEAVLALLDNSHGYNMQNGLGKKQPLGARAAWKVDEGHERFMPMPLIGLTCTLETVVTADGGF